MKGVGTTTKTMSAPSVATETSVVATIKSLSLMPGRYGVFSWVLLMVDNLHTYIRQTPFGYFDMTTAVVSVSGRNRATSIRVSHVRRFILTCSAERERLLS